MDSHSRDRTRTAGTGSGVPSAIARPAIGSRGTGGMVEEVRVETKAVGKRCEGGGSGDEANVSV